MQITKAFLLTHRTKKGAWTKEQFRIIGMTWPPKQNWMSLVKGKELSGAEVAEFIRAKDISAKGLSTLEKCYLGVLDGLKELSVGQRVVLMGELKKLQEPAPRDDFGFKHRADMTRIALSTNIYKD